MQDQDDVSRHAHPTNDKTLFTMYDGVVQSVSGPI